MKNWITAIVFAWMAWYVYDRITSPSPSGTTTSTDSETGCQYLLAYGVNGGAAITPRIDADGVHMGCKGFQEVDHAAP